MILKTIGVHKKCNLAPWVRFDFKSCRNSLQRCVNIVENAKERESHVNKIAQRNCDLRSQFSFTRQSR